MRLKGIDIKVHVHHTRLNLTKFVLCVRFDVLNLTKFVLCVYMF